MKLIVAGGRDFNDPDIMAGVIFDLAIEGIIDNEAELVTGMARGADKIAFDLWMPSTNTIHQFPADWDGPHGKGAGFARNRDMAKFADMLVAFWDGQSRGTKHMIETMERMGKPVFVFDYQGRRRP